MAGRLGQELPKSPAPLVTAWPQRAIRTALAQALDRHRQRRLERSLQPRKPPSRVTPTPEELAADAMASPCSPDRPECQPLIIYLPDELFSDIDSSSDGYDDSDSSSDEEEQRTRRSALKSAEAATAEEQQQQQPPPRRNGQVVPMATAPTVILPSVGKSFAALELLMDMIVHKFEPNQPDMLDRMIAMFNAGRRMGEEGLTQMHRLEAQRRRHARRCDRRVLKDPDWSPTRRKMSMAECFCSLGRLLIAKSADHPAATASSSSDEVDEGASGCSTASPPPSPKEVRIEITDETLGELGGLCPDSENYFRRLVIGSTTRSQLIHFCHEEDSEAALQRRWLRHCARQLRRSVALEKRLTEDVYDCLERRLSGVLYEATTCSVLANVLAGDLLELVMHVVGHEFKIVCMLHVSSVTELDRMAMETRSLQSDDIDISKVFHYQNESICALFTCHMFKRFDRPLNDAPIDTELFSLSGRTRDTSTILDDEGFEIHIQGD